VIGLGTYAYFWQHAEGLSLTGAFEDTKAQGVDLFQICDYAPLLEMSEAQLQDAAGAARELGLAIICGGSSTSRRSSTRGSSAAWCCTTRPRTPSIS
jgi:hypothetical protein